jgi:outer membrane protein TolC
MVAEERLAKKVISEAQMFSFRLEAERAQIDSERRRFDHENDKVAFARLTGSPPLREEEIPDAIPPVAPQLERIEALLAGFLAQKDPPSLEAVNFLQTMRIERLNLANQKTRLKPKFNFTIGASQDQQSYSINVAQKYQVNSYYAGVSGNWTIFDGFSAGAGVRSSMSKLRQMENDYRGLTERLAQQAQSQVRLIGFDARYTSINDRLLASSESYLAQKKEELTRGVSSEEAVNGASIGLHEAQLNAYVARADYYSQVGEFLGTVVEDPVLANLPVK